MCTDLLNQYPVYDYLKSAHDLKIKDSPFRQTDCLINHIKKLLPYSDYGTREAISFLISKVVKKSMKGFESKKLSDDFNICGSVYGYIHGKVPLFVMKFAKKEKDNDDIAREFYLTQRYLNPLRVLTPNFMYAYTFVHKSETSTRHKALYEYVKGRQLNGLLRDLNDEDLIGILLQVFLSLHIAQEACLFTHYDLHADNILIDKQPFEHTYSFFSKKLKVKCNYKATIIDTGYAFVAGAGLGDTQPQVLGIARLERAGVRKDIFSTGFDIIKLLSFIQYRLVRNKINVSNEKLATLLKKYSVNVFGYEKTDTSKPSYVKMLTRFEKAKSKYYSLNYKHSLNCGMNSQIIINELVECLSETSQVFDVVDEAEYIIRPPEVMLAPLTLGLLGDHYNHLVKTSITNEIYTIILTIYQQNLKKILSPETSGLLHQEPISSLNISRDDNIRDHLASIGMTEVAVSDVTLSVVSEAMAMLILLSSMYEKDWDILQEFRKCYYNISNFNSKREVSWKDFHVVEIDVSNDDMYELSGLSEGESDDSYIEDEKDLETDAEDWETDIGDEDTDVEETDVEDTDVEDTDVEGTDVEDTDIGDDDTDVEETDEDTDIEETDLEDEDNIEETDLEDDSDLVDSDDSD